ncbi:MAG: gamma-glutamyltransferase [candidate division NC10 bacterium]|nr:gamma-glutamyltransferase [candidate division NC10 bacterium]
MRAQTLIPPFAHRPLVLGRRGMVAAGHPLAALAGIHVLLEGGNAADAAAATAWTMAVVRPHASGLGGDAFSLIYRRREGKVVGLNASGRAPAAATVEFFRRRGSGRIPESGVLPCIVPGAVDGWLALAERHGTMPRQRLMAPAIELAEEGFGVSNRFAEDVAAHGTLLAKQREAAALFLPQGRPLQPGERFRQPGLARVLRAVAEGGREVFYRGPVAKAIAAFCQREGGLLTEADLAAHVSDWITPIESTYRGHRILEFPPNSQGLALLLALNILEGFEPGLLQASPAEWLHLCIEAKKLALADRDRYISDPARVEIPLAELLSKAYGAERRAKIDPGKAAPEVQSGDAWPQGEDTTYLAAADAEGNLVSHIQSIFSSFGGGVVAGETGILLNNRLKAFTLREGHANRLEPGKRTMHTLNPVLVFEGEAPVLAVGSPGAEGQVQILVQVLTAFLHGGADLQRVIEAPRWRNDVGVELLVESRIPRAVLAALAAKGHRVRRVGAWSQTMGGVQAIQVNGAAGLYLGGADPRREGYAIGW